MKKPLSYSTKYIDNELNREIAKRGIDTNTDLKEMDYQRLDQCIADQAYDFKKNNFNFSKAAILANEYELALKMTGIDTVEGALIWHNYPLACAILPKSPEGDSIVTDEIR